MAFESLAWGLCPFLRLHRVSCSCGGPLLVSRGISVWVGRFWKSGGRNTSPSPRIFSGHRVAATGMWWGFRPLHPFCERTEIKESERLWMVVASGSGAISMVGSPVSAYSPSSFFFLHFLFFPRLAPQLHHQVPLRLSQSASGWGLFGVAASPQDGSESPWPGGEPWNGNMCPQAPGGAGLGAAHRQQFLGERDECSRGGQASVCGVAVGRSCLGRGQRGGDTEREVSEDPLSREEWLWVSLRFCWPWFQFLKNRLRGRLVGCCGMGLSLLLHLTSLPPPSDRAGWFDGTFTRRFDVPN